MAMDNLRKEDLGLDFGTDEEVLDGYKTAP